MSEVLLSDLDYAIELSIADFKKALDGYFSVEKIETEFYQDRDTWDVKIKFGVQPIKNFHQLLEPVMIMIIRKNFVYESELPDEYFTFSYEPYKLTLTIKAK